MPSKAFRRIPGTIIYIGNIDDAEDLALLGSHNIRAVLNVSDHSTPDGYQDSIARFHVRLSDPMTSLCGSNPIEEAVQVFAIALERAQNRGGNILVHCINGHNRSSLIVAIWLTKVGHPLQEAVKIAKVKDNKPWMKDLGFVWEA